MSKHIITCPFCGSTSVSPAVNMSSGYFDCIGCERTFFERATKTVRTRHCTRKVTYTVNITKSGNVDKRQLTRNKNERKNYESADYSWSRGLKNRGAGN